MISVMPKAVCLDSEDSWIRKYSYPHVKAFEGRPRVWWFVSPQVVVVLFGKVVEPLVGDTHWRK